MGRLLLGVDRPDPEVRDPELRSSSSPSSAVGIGNSVGGEENVVSGMYISVGNSLSSNPSGGASLGSTETVIENVACWMLYERCFGLPTVFVG